MYAAGAGVDLVGVGVGFAVGFGAAVFVGVAEGFGAVVDLLGAGAALVGLVAGVFDGADVAVAPPAGDVAAADGAVVGDTDESAGVGAAAESAGAGAAAESAGAGATAESPGAGASDDIGAGPPRPADAPAEPDVSAEATVASAPE